MFTAVRTALRNFWVVVALLTFGVVVGACSTQSGVVHSPSVVEVIDGDTVVIEFSNDVTETVRLLGVDTPETVDPSRPVQCFGAEASAYVRTILPPGTLVHLERDVEARDHFGRLLAYIYRVDDGLFVNGELLRLGFADISIYPPNESYADELERLVTSARTQNSGLWEACGGADVALDPPPLSVAGS